MIPVIGMKILLLVNILEIDYYMQIVVMLTQFIAVHN